jgi:hypothetical protein
MNDNELADMMLTLLPEDGTAKGNITLRSEWQTKAGNGIANDPENYWRIRQLLLDTGKVELGKGKGGSVRLVVTPDTATTNATTEPIPPSQERRRESDLYGPVHETIQNSWAISELAFPAGSFVSCISAFQGRATTGGKWTRPDITLVFARKFAYLGPLVEVVTFEVKPFESLGVDAVFETAAHTARAHRSFLLAEVPDPQHGEDDFLQSDEFLRIETECLRFGVGLATFVEPDNLDTWTVRVRPPAHRPDPSLVENWLSQCFAKNGVPNELSQLIDSVFGKTESAVE